MVPNPAGRSDTTKDHLRLLARVARMYHEQDLRQPEVAAALNISQPHVSRLLKETVTRGMVRTVVTLPDGVHTELEEDAQVHATRLVARLANLTNGRPVFVPLPGVVATTAIRDALLQDPTVIDVQAQWNDLTVVLVGIGSLEPSPLLLSSGNAVSHADQEELRALGAVGDVCLHFFDSAGKPIDSGFDQRVIGIDAPTFRAVPRRVGVAGGMRKASAIKAAIEGGWVNILITDLHVARHLASTR